MQNSSPHHVPRRSGTCPQRYLYPGEMAFILLLSSLLRVSAGIAGFEVEVGLGDFCSSCAFVTEATLLGDASNYCRDRAGTRPGGNIQNFDNQALTGFIGLAFGMRLQIFQ